MASPNTLKLHENCPKPTRQWNWVATDVKAGKAGTKLRVKAQGTKNIGDNAYKRHKQAILSTMTRQQALEAKTFLQRQARAKTGGAFGKPQEVKA